MVETTYDDEPNPLEQMFFGGAGDDQRPLLQERSAFEDDPQSVPASNPPQRAAAVIPNNVEYNSSDEEDDEEYGAECDPNGDVAICDACNRVMPLSKYDKHISYYCKKQTSECPFCLEPFPQEYVRMHMDMCKKIKDPNMVTCKYCKQEMLPSELKDHAIAHLVHQKMVERQLVERVAEQNEFFEENKLDTAGDGRAPVLSEAQLAELPESDFEVTEVQDEEDIIFKCTICQMDFEDGCRVRTLLCLHQFHKDCIDRWLSTINGSCVICKVIQTKPKDRINAD